MELMESGMASIVGAALAGTRGTASADVAIQEGGSGRGAVEAKGGVGVFTVDVTSVFSRSVAGSGAAMGLTLCTEGSVAVPFSGGGVDSEGCRGAFGSSDDSEEAARRLLKDEPIADVAEASLAFDSGGLNKLLGGAPLDTSTPVESLVNFKFEPKLNCAASLSAPVSPKVKDAAVGLGDESLASSP